MADRRKAREKMSTTATLPASGDRLHMRIPPDVKDVLREMAEEDGRTISNWILHQIRVQARERGKLK